MAFHRIVPEDDPEARRAKPDSAIMRILNHDYTGHPFQVQLSRSLAGRDHEVLHAYSASFQTPHGALKKRDTDPDNFHVLGIRLDQPFQKWSFLKRRKQEIEYGQLAAREIERWKPDIVLSGNTPTEAQKVIQRVCQTGNTRFVFWVQDLYSVAVQRILRKKLPGIGHAIGYVYMRMERDLLRKSDGIVLITEDFKPIMDQWGVDLNRAHVIHNWAPLDSVPLHPKSNPWSQERGLADKLCLLYSGTLGMKHNPDILLQLALHFKDNSRVRVVVVSEGPAPDWLKAKRDEHHLKNLLVLGWQPFEVLAEVLASADVLLAILEPDAGVFSVPSKVLTYLCAQRPLLLAVPSENLAAKIVEDHNAGFVVSPDDLSGFIRAADDLIGNEGLRHELACNARTCAETHFDIEKITDRFEEVFRQACS